nr:retrovirus-related Pol polyprotein from transposon TNT 1-94 [Tanacetum cinerariifolium]
MPQQNGVMERRNRTLVEAARTMLTFANLPSFLWAEAIATACFTQNRSIIHKRFDKTPYELINKRKPNIKFFRVFGCRCYLLNDFEDVGKLKAKGDIGVFVEEVILPSLNTQSIPINKIPNGDEASTSHNVFNERLEDAYFDASTFHDPSNVQTFYQPYPHEKKWTKDHPLHKIIGDPKSSVRTRVWRLVPRPEGKSVIKTKWIFKNKKDESSLVIQNKARLVAVGYSQQEGIDYDETFAPVKNKQEKDKIGTKPDQIKKKREAWRSPGKSRESQKQSQSRKQENLKKAQKEGPKMQTPSKLIKRKNKG